MSRQLAQKILAQLDNKNITDVIKEKHSDKLDTLIKNLEHIKSNDIDNVNLDPFLEEIKKNSDTKTHATIYIDTIITNANLLETQLHDEQEIIQKPIIKPKLKPKNSKYIESSNQSINEIIRKSDVKESLNVNHIASVVAKTITQLKDNSGEMIGIFGKWGRGKTYLAKKIQAKLEEEKISYKWVDFSAWKYSNTEQTWVYLYETIATEYWGKEEPSFSFNYTKSLFGKAKKIKNIIPKSDFFLLLISIILIVISFYYELLKELIMMVGIVITIKIIYTLFIVYRFSSKHIIDKYVSKTLSKDILGLQAEIEKEIVIILKAWVNDGTDSKVVLFVDDLDRANLDDMLKILDSLRIILDNEDIYKRLIIITAIDEELLKTSFEKKYENQELFYEYLQKIFILGIKLDKINSEEVIEFTEKLINSKEKSKETDDKTTAESQQEEVNSNVTENKKSSSRKSESEISKEEKLEFLDKIKELNNPTPRQIRIFYYKFIILKLLVNTSQKGTDVSMILTDLIEMENNKNNLDKGNLAKIVELP